MVEGKVVALFFVFLVVAFFMGAFLGPFESSVGITGDVIDVESNYTYTRAVCSSDGNCMDVIISCRNGDVESVEPILRTVDFSEMDLGDLGVSEEPFCE